MRAFSRGEFGAISARCALTPGALAIRSRCECRLSGGGPDPELDDAEVIGGVLPGPLLTPPDNGVGRGCSEFGCRLLRFGNGSPGARPNIDSKAAARLPPVHSDKCRVKVCSPIRSSSKTALGLRRWISSYRQSVPALTQLLHGRSPVHFLQGQQPLPSNARLVIQFAVPTRSAVA